MIRVTAGNNLKRFTDGAMEDETLRHFLEAHEIDYTRGGMTIDGSPLQPGDIDKTFAQMGITSSTYLLQVVKADNA